MYKSMLNMIDSIDSEYQGCVAFSHMWPSFWQLHGNYLYHGCIGYRQNRNVQSTYYTHNVLSHTQVALTVHSGELSAAVTRYAWVQILAACG